MKDVNCLHIKNVTVINSNLYFIIYLLTHLLQDVILFKIFQIIVTTKVAS